MIRLRELRESRGLKQTAFAKAFGVAQNTVSNWENGNRILDVDTAAKIADFFNVSVDFLLNRTNNPKQQASLDNIDEERLDEELIDALCKLNDEELNQVTSFVQFLLSSPKE